MVGGVAIAQKPIQRRRRPKATSFSSFRKALHTGSAVQLEGAVRTPAALIRGNVEKSPGDCRAGGTFFQSWNGKMKGGINAGVMVLEPSKDELGRMLSHLEQRMSVVRRGPWRPARAKSRRAHCGRGDTG